MFRRDGDRRQYSLGYFTRKYDLDRGSARLILATASGPREANRKARTLKFRPADRLSKPMEMLSSVP